jgi:hypothetical protein
MRSFKEAPVGLSLTLEDGNAVTGEPVVLVIGMS